jgi:hypothetical protein
MLLFVETHRNKKYTEGIVSWYTVSKREAMPFLRAGQKISNGVFTNRIR